MFERYTEKARRAIFFARYEASQFGSPYIESEHLLLGLLRETKSLYKLFPASHASAATIRKQIEGNNTVREKFSTSIDIPVSEECERILAYAAEEANRLSHKFVGTEHLFLGLLREQDCFATTLLNERGVSVDTARNHIASQLPEKLGSTPRSPGIPTGYTSHKLLYNPVSEMVIVELRRVGGEHLLLTRLFLRHKEAESYQQIGNPDENLSYESPVTCDKQPLVVFNSIEWDKGRRAGNWAGVYSFNLNTKELALCFSKETITCSEPLNRFWIVELIFLSDDGQKLYMNVGVQKAASGGAVVHYYLASVNLADKELELLSRLKDIHF
jgi:Clp amino terminal domain, pathogenicity island component